MNNLPLKPNAIEMCHGKNCVRAVGESANIFAAAFGIGLGFAFAAYLLSKIN